MRITADAASDTVAVYETATARGATVVIPPARTANVSGHGPRSPARDRTITAVKQLGRRRWKKTSGYHRQSEQQGVKRTTCVILDTNGEYRTAFQNQKGDDSWKDTGPGKALYIPSDRGKADERLAIPYWFMNAEDFARLFQASKGVQRPVLLEALRLARNDTASASPLAVLREELVHEMNRIWSLSGKDEKTSKDVRDVASGLKRRIRDNDFAAAWGEAETKYTLTKDDVETALGEVSNTAGTHIDNGTYPKVLPADARKTIRNAIEPVYEKLTGGYPGESTDTTGRSADAPSHFDKLKFRSRHIEQVLRREESGGARARDFPGRCCSASIAC